MQKNNNCNITLQIFNCFFFVIVIKVVIKSQLKFISFLHILIAYDALSCNILNIAVLLDMSLLYDIATIVFPRPMTAGDEDYRACCETTVNSVIN